MAPDTVTRTRPTVLMAIANGTRVAYVGSITDAIGQGTVVHSFRDLSDVIRYVVNLDTPSPSGDTLSGVHRESLRIVG